MLNTKVLKLVVQRMMRFIFLMFTNNLIKPPVSIYYTRPVKLIFVQMRKAELSELVWLLPLYLYYMLISIVDTVRLED